MVSGIQTHFPVLKTTKECSAVTSNSRLWQTSLQSHAATDLLVLSELNLT